MKRIFYLSPLALPVLLWSARPARPGGAEVELDEARIFIEFNSTDEDFGIQFFWDGDAWDSMAVLGPDERTLLRVQASRSLAEQGLTEGFFESAEPSIDELTMEEFFERFPEGTYEFEGETLKGEELEGEVEFSHTLPAPAANLYPAEGQVLDLGSPLVASFDAVRTDLEGNPVEIEQYEMILEFEGEILRIFSMVLSGDTAHPSVSIPPEFLQEPGEYKLEIIAEEEGGNRTISETSFFLRR